MIWSPGQQIVRREVITQGVWLGYNVIVIEDSPEWLITYVPEGSPFGFPDVGAPTQNGKHPWSHLLAWKGNGVLMLQKPGESHSIWHFWEDDSRNFSCWYINIQLPFVRNCIGFDTEDLELDFIVYPDGRWEIKDEDLLQERVLEGRWSQSIVNQISKYGEIIKTRLEKGERWWDEKWARWIPNPTWSPKPLPSAWDKVPYNAEKLVLSF